MSKDCRKIIFDISFYSDVPFHEMSSRALTRDPAEDKVEKAL